MILRGKVKKLVLKSREAALLAVTIYNNPQTVFKTYAYIVNMCIAWTSLFHAMFEKRNIKYFYKKNTNRLEYEKIDGEYKAWELSKCCKEFYKEIMTPARANLETIIKLRNKIEHRFLPELDSHVFGECQSCLFNYEKMLISEFGNEHAINSSLAFGLQFSEVYEEKQIKAMKSMKMKELKNIRQYMDEFRQIYDDDILESMEYSFRVFLIPQTGNNINSSDRSIEFIKKSDLSEEDYEKIKNDITLIKNKNIPVSNYDKLKAGEVVEKIKESLDIEFSLYKHTLCWKYYNVRPSKDNKNPEITDTRYCVYDNAHKDYLYTKAWIEKLRVELSKEEVRDIVFKRKAEN